MNVSVKCFKPVDTYVKVSDTRWEPAKTVQFVASSVDFLEDYSDSVTLLKADATKLNAKQAIRAKIINHIEQNINPWQEYQETIEA